MRNEPKYNYGLILGVLIAVVLILISSQGRFGGNPDLEQVFALQPTPELPDLSLPDFDRETLPPEVQAAADLVGEQLGMGGGVKPVQASARSARLEIQITELRQVEGGIRVAGVVRNISSGEIVVPIDAFELRDTEGASYVAGGGGSATLRSGESTPLDLTVPLPAGRGLMLITRFNPDPPVEQVLFTVSP